MNKAVEAASTRRILEYPCRTATQAATTLQSMILTVKNYGLDLSE